MFKEHKQSVNLSMNVSEANHFTCTHSSCLQLDQPSLMILAFHFNTLRSFRLMRSLVAVVTLSVTETSIVKVLAHAHTEVTCLSSTFYMYQVISTIV